MKSVTLAIVPGPYTNLNSTRDHKPFFSISLDSGLVFFIKNDINCSFMYSITWHVDLISQIFGNVISYRIYSVFVQLYYTPLMSVPNCLGHFHLNMMPLTCSSNSLNTNLPIIDNHHMSPFCLTIIHVVFKRVRFPSCVQNKLVYWT